MKKRILSLLLAFSMAATLAPATALVGSSTAKAAAGTAATNGGLYKGPGATNPFAGTPGQTNSYDEEIVVPTGDVATTSNVVFWTNGKPASADDINTGMDGVTWTEVHVSKQGITVVDADNASGNRPDYGVGTGNGVYTQGSRLNRSEAHYTVSFDKTVDKTLSQYAVDFNVLALNKRLTYTLVPASEEIKLGGSYDGARNGATANFTRTTPVKAGGQFQVFVVDKIGQDGQINVKSVPAGWTVSETVVKNSGTQLYAGYGTEYIINVPANEIAGTKTIKFEETSNHNEATLTFTVVAAGEASGTTVDGTGVTPDTIAAIPGAVAYKASEYTGESIALKINTKSAADADTTDGKDILTVKCVSISDTGVVSDAVAKVSTLAYDEENSAAGTSGSWDSAYTLNITGKNTSVKDIYEFTDEAGNKTYLTVSVAGRMGIAGAATGGGTEEIVGITNSGNKYTIPGVNYSTKTYVGVVVKDLNSYDDENVSATIVGNNGLKIKKINTDVVDGDHVALYEIDATNFDTNKTEEKIFFESIDGEVIEVTLKFGAVADSISILTLAETYFNGRPTGPLTFQASPGVDSVSFMLKHAEGTAKRVDTTVTWDAANGGKDYISINVEEDVREIATAQVDKITLSGLSKLPLSKPYTLNVTTKGDGIAEATFKIVVTINNSGVKVVFKTTEGKVNGAFQADTEAGTNPFAYVNETSFFQLVPFGGNINFTKAADYFSSFGRRVIGFEGKDPVTGRTLQYSVSAENIKAADPIEFTVVWDNATMEITYSPNEGSGSMPKQNVYAASTLTKNTFSRAGYDFKGWTAVRNGNQAKYKDQQGITEDLWNDLAANGGNLYAVWAPKEVTFKFVDNRDGKTKGPGYAEMSEFKVAYSTSNTIPRSKFANAYTCNTYAFTGWNTEANGSGTSFTKQQIEAGGKINPSYFPGAAAGEVTLYAQWTEGFNIVLYSKDRKTSNGEIYTVIGVPKINNGVGNVPSGMVELDRVNADTNVYIGSWVYEDGKDGYDVALDGNIYYTGAQRNTYLYPVDDTNIVYTASFYKAESETLTGSNTRTFHSGDEAVIIPTVSRPNWTFIGWYIDGNNNRQKDPGESIVIDAGTKSITTADAIALCNGTALKLRAHLLPNAGKADLAQTTETGFVLTGRDTWSVEYGTSLASVERWLTSRVQLQGVGESTLTDDKPAKVVWTSTPAYNPVSKDRTQYTFKGVATPSAASVGNANESFEVLAYVDVLAAPAANAKKITVKEISKPATIFVESGYNVAEIKALVDKVTSVTIVGDDGRSYPRTIKAGAFNDSLNTELKYSNAGTPTSVGDVTTTANRRYIVLDGVYTIQTAQQGNSGGNVFDDAHTGNFYYPAGSIVEVKVVVGDPSNVDEAQVTSIATIPGYTFEEGTLYSTIVSKVSQSVEIYTNDTSKKYYGRIVWDFSPLSDYTETTKNGYTKTITGTVSSTEVNWGSVEKKVSTTITIAGKEEKVATTAAEIQKLLADNYLLRFFNVKTGEHFYTTDFEEYVTIATKKNWIHETYVSGSNTFKGSRTASALYDTPVYRLFNIVNGGHLYTKDLNEVAVRVATGKWVRDNSTFFVSMDEKNNSTPYYRQVRTIFINGKAMLQHNYAPKAEFDYNNANGWTADFDGEPIWYSPAN